MGPLTRRRPGRVRQHGQNIPPCPPPVLPRTDPSTAPPTILYDARPGGGNFVLDGLSTGGAASSPESGDGVKNRVNFRFLDQFGTPNGGQLSRLAFATSGDASETNRPSGFQKMIQTSGIQHVLFPRRSGAPANCGARPVNEGRQDERSCSAAGARRR